MTLEKVIEIIQIIPSVSRNVDEETLLASNSDKRNRKRVFIFTLQYYIVKILKKSITFVI